MNIRLLIADDHQLMRQGLRALIEKEAGMTVVAETANGKETIAQVAQTHPHVVIMDVTMPDLNGIEATRRIKKANKKVRIVALSAHSDRHFVAEMLRAGASAYILKQTAYEELIRAVRAVMEGETYLSPAVTQGVVDSLVSSLPKSGENPAFASLTQKEREVLQRVAEGQSTKEIAAALSVSVKTIETHRSHIMDKLKLHSIAQLTKYAIREGVTSLDI